MKAQEYEQLYDCDNGASISLKSEILISQFITEDCERSKSFGSIHLYQLGYCLLRVVVEKLENYFPEINFNNYFQICIDSNCQPKKVCELSRKSLVNKNKNSADYALFELITHAICNTLTIYDKGMCERLMQDYYNTAREYFLELQQKIIDKKNGSEGKKKFEAERVRVKEEVIRLYKNLSTEKKTKKVTQIYAYISPKLKQFMEKEKLSKQEYEARTVEGWIREHQKKITV